MTILALVFMVLTAQREAAPAARGASGEGQITSIAGESLVRAGVADRSQKTTIPARDLSRYVGERKDLQLDPQGRADHRWKVDESLETAAKSRATVLFDDFGALLSVGANTRVVLLRSRLDSRLHFRLEAGEVTVWDQGGGSGWTLIALGAERYVLLKGSGRVALPETLEVYEGEGGMYRGAVPDRALVADGKLVDPPQAVAVRKDRAAALEAAFALLAEAGPIEANRWVLDAEKGDLVPARALSGGTQGEVVSELSQRQSLYDQPKAGAFVAVASGSERRAPSATAGESEFLNLLDQRNVGSVVTVARIFRTRIIGPGFGGTPLRASSLTLLPRVNPDVIGLQLNAPRSPRR